MKLAIVNLSGGGLSGGYRKYLERLVPLLRRDPGVSTVDVFVPHEVAALDGSYLSWPAGDHLFGFRTLRRTIQQRRPDVILIPTARWIDCGGIPTVVMVRNMEPLQVPFDGNPLMEKVRNVFRRRSALRACRKADRVIAVSAHVAHFLRSRWGIDSSKIGVVCHGADEPVDEEIPPIDGIDTSPFLFTAGSIRPARGLEDVIAALPLVEGPRLLIGGGVDPGMEGHLARLMKLARASGASERIAWAGHLSARQMAWCFRHAAAFVMTSRAEACPNIALEAMRAGALTVSTENPPMPEFFGEAAVYYRPGDANSLAGSLSRALRLKEGDRHHLRVAAQARAATFTWSRTAADTISELEKVLDCQSDRSRRRMSG